MLIRLRKGEELDDELEEQRKLQYQMQVFEEFYKVKRRDEQHETENQFCIQQLLGVYKSIKN